VVLARRGVGGIGAVAVGTVHAVKEILHSERGTFPYTQRLSVGVFRQVGNPLRCTILDIGLEQVYPGIPVVPGGIPRQPRWLDPGDNSFIIILGIHNDRVSYLAGVGKASGLPAF